VSKLRPMPLETELEMPVVPVRGLSTTQKAIRRMGIGGSEIACVLGISPFGGPLDVWQGKVEGRELEETPALRRGRILEPAVCEMYAEEAQPATLLTPGTMVHPTRPIMVATPDRIAEFRGGERRLLEAKTALHFNAGDWGEPGTDQVPQAYLCQVVWTLAVAELRVADIAVLISGQDFRIYRVTIDQELVEMMVDAAERFWRDFVLPKRPPPPDASQGYQDWLCQHYPEEREPPRPASAAEEAIVSELRRIEPLADQYEAEVKRLRNELRAQIADSEGIEGSGWRATWRKAKPSARTDWKALAEACGPPEELIQKHTILTPGSRRLLVRWTEE
jgi:putative phage-type endonuclease